MKAFTRICLILCGVLTLLGFAGIGISIVMGIEPAQILDLAHYPGKYDTHGEELLEDVKELPDSLRDTLEDVKELPGDIQDTLKDIRFHSKKASDGSAIGYEESLSFETVSSIFMDLNLCDLTIKKHDGDQILLEITNGQDTFSCQQDGDCLIIKDDRYTSRTDFQEEALFLTVLLPERTYDQLDISIDVGDVRTEELSCQTLNVQTDVGDMVFDTLSLREAALSTGVGDMKIGQITASSQVSLESGTGDLKVDSFDGAELTINCDLGDVDVTACGRESDYNYDLTCDIGDLTLHHKEAHDNGHHQELGHHLASDHNSDRSLSLYCGFGDLTLTFTEED